LKTETLPKSERLCSRKQIAALMEKGTVFFHFPFKVSWIVLPAAAGAPCCQVMVNAPKRNFKKAVTRNLLKRRTREAFRKNKTELYETLSAQNKTLAVFFHYVSPEISGYADIETSIRKILAALAEAVINGTGVPVTSGH
jgi:ribonuclease P protein component